MAAGLPDSVVTAVRRLGDQHGVRSIRVFGSVARGEAGSQSDLDLLVTLEPGRSLLDLVAFWQDVEKAIGAEVDVVSEGGLSPHMRDLVLAEAIPL